MRVCVYLAPIIVFATTLAAPAMFQTITHSLPAELKPRLIPFLRTELCKGSADDRNIKYSAALVSLRAGKPAHIIVFANGGGLCGTGGCLALVYATKSATFEQIARINGHPPLRLLPTKTHGWRDLGAKICGGGILKCYDGVFKFDGADIYLHDWARAARPDVKSAVTIFEHDGDKPLCKGAVS